MKGKKMQLNEDQGMTWTANSIKIKYKKFLDHIFKFGTPKKKKEQTQIS